MQTLYSISCPHHRKELTVLHMKRALGSQGFIVPQDPGCEGVDWVPWTQPQESVVISGQNMETDCRAEPQAGGNWRGLPPLRGNCTSGVKKSVTLLGQVQYRLKGDGHFPNQGRNNESFNIQNEHTFLTQN